MSAFSNWGENWIVEGIFRSRALSKPTQLQLALCSGVPDEEHLRELSGGNYARWIFGPPSDSAFIFHNVPTSGLLYLGSGITPIRNWTGARVDISGAAILDQDGNVIVKGAFTEYQTVSANGDLTFASGAISFQLL